MPKKNLIIEEPDEDPTISQVAETKRAKVPKKDLKKYLVLIHPDTYAELTALVASRNLDRIRNGSRAYSLNQLLNGLVDEYLERDEIKEEVAKARKKLGV